MTTTLERPTRTDETDHVEGRFYRGEIQRGHQRVYVYAAETTPPFLLEHRLVRHSPDGFAWGYGGSGPSDLALNMLIDALGDAAWCARCGGKGSETYTEQGERGEGEHEYEGRCSQCRGERTGPLCTPDIYQAFKVAHVAEWPQDAGWKITAAEVAQFARARALEAL